MSEKQQKTKKTTNVVTQPHQLTIEAVNNHI